MGGCKSRNDNIARTAVLQKEEKAKSELQRRLSSIISSAPCFYGPEAHRYWSLSK
jgi:hypothetical protein